PPYLCCALEAHPRRRRARPRRCRRGGSAGIAPSAGLGRRAMLGVDPPGCFGASGGGPTAGLPPPAAQQTRQDTWRRRLRSAAAGRTTMSDYSAMQARLVADIGGAPDLDALESLRVAALGKTGSVSALLKTLRSEERRVGKEGRARWAA